MTPALTGPTYRVQCYRQARQGVCGLSKWYTDLESALLALLEQQQQPWQSVALVPQVARPPRHEQLGLTLKEETR